MEHLSKVVRSKVSNFKLSDILKKTPTKLEQELDNEAVGESISGFDDFTEHINDAKKMKNKDLGDILIRNRIKDPTTGNAFYIDNHNRVLVKGGSNTLNRTQLTELLKKEYKPGFVYK